MLPLIVDTVHTYLLDQHQFILYQLILLKSKGIQMGYVKLISLMANKKCIDVSFDIFNVVLKIVFLLLRGCA